MDIFSGTSRRSRLSCEFLNVLKATRNGSFFIHFLFYFIMYIL